MDPKSLQQDKEDWFPTKFELYRGKWRSSRKHVKFGSRLISDLVVTAYEQSIRSYAKGDLIDLGCGNAPLAGIYKDHVSSYTWVDWPNSAHQIFKLDQMANLDEQLPFKDESFDTILLTDVLEHIKEPVNLLREMTRILRPGGKIILGVPFMYWLHEEPNDHYRYTRHTLKHFAQSNNLQIVKIEETGGGLHVVADVLCKMFNRKIKKIFGYLIYLIITSLLKVPFINNFNNSFSRKIPLGYIAIYQG